MPIMEERRLAGQSRRSEADHGRHHAARRRFGERLWLHGLAGLIVFSTSLLLGGLQSVKNQVDAAWKNVAADFRWFVLVKGTQLEVDEVGRFLKELDGPRDITYLP